MKERVTQLEKERDEIFEECNSKKEELITLNKQLQSTANEKEKLK